MRKAKRPSHILIVPTRRLPPSSTHVFELWKVHKRRRRPCIRGDRRQVCSSDSAPCPAFGGINARSAEKDEEPVVPAGTHPHNGLSVLPGEWESTTVAMFVTSSHGHILHRAPASRGLAASHKNTCICFSWTRIGGPDAFWEESGRGMPVTFLTVEKRRLFVVAMSLVVRRKHATRWSCSLLCSGRF